VTRPILRFPVRFPDSQSGASTNAVRLNVTYNGVNQTITVMTCDSAQSYWVTADHQSGTNVTDLCLQLQNAVVSAFQPTTPSAAMSIRIDSGSSLLVVSGAHAFRFHWSDATNQFIDPGAFGFPSGSTASTTALTSSYLPGQTWLPARNPATDTLDVPVAVSDTVACRDSSRQRTFRMDDGTVTQRALTFPYELRENVVPLYAGDVQGPSGTFGACFDSLVRGQPVRFYSSSNDVGSLRYRLYKGQPTEASWSPQRDSNQALYTVAIDLRSTTPGEG
jgi:hypothetical protein